jgi:isopenicillin N synthase-like dioxygenase
LYDLIFIKRLGLEEYGEHLGRLATTLFKVIVMELILNPEESKSHMAKSTGFVHVYCYPLRSMANSAWDIDVHIGSSVMSSLNQYELGGLEVLKDNEWLQVIVRLNKHTEWISVNYFVFPDEDSVIWSSKYRSFTYGDF